MLTITKRIDCDGEPLCLAVIIIGADEPVDAARLRHQAAREGWTTGTGPHGEPLDYCPAHTSRATGDPS